MQNTTKATEIRESIGNLLPECQTKILKEGFPFGCLALNREELKGAKKSTKEST